MIRKNLLLYKIIRIKTSSKSLFDSYMEHFKPELETCHICGSTGNCHIHDYYGISIIDCKDGRQDKSDLCVLRVFCDSCQHAHAIPSCSAIRIPYRFIPKTHVFTLKSEGSKSNLRSGLPTFKFVCPKMKWVYDKSTQKAHRQCFCENPCTTSKCGRMVYIYPEKDLRAYPSAVRGTAEWDNTYKIRTVVERDINHIKDNLCLAGRKTQNEKTLHADLILAGITQLITVVLADKINHPEYIRSLKPLVA